MRQGASLISIVDSSPATRICLYRYVQCMCTGKHATNRTSCALIEGDYNTCEQLASSHRNFNVLGLIDIMRSSTVQPFAPTCDHSAGLTIRWKRLTLRSKAPCFSASDVGSYPLCCEDFARPSAKTSASLIVHGHSQQNVPSLDGVTHRAHYCMYGADRLIWALALIRGCAATSQSLKAVECDRTGSFDSFRGKGKPMVAATVPDHARRAHQKRTRHCKLHRSNTARGCKRVNLVDVSGWCATSTASYRRQEGPHIPQAPICAPRTGTTTMLTQVN